MTNAYFTHYSSQWSNACNNVRVLHEYRGALEKLQAKRAANFTYGHLNPSLAGWANGAEERRKVKCWRDYFFSEKESLLDRTMNFWEWLQVTLSSNGCLYDL